MNRNTHRFHFSGVTIAKAARAMQKHHQDRITWWKVEQEAAIVKAKAAGVEVRESDVTGGKRVDVIIDPSVQSRLSECASKINSHRQKAERFELEADAYETQSGMPFELDPDDVVYFGIVKNTGES